MSLRSLQWGSATLSLPYLNGLEHDVSGDEVRRVNCVVLDRDGTLIRHVPYLRNPAEVELLPTVKSGLELLADRNIKLLLHTNQSGIGRGYFSLADALACNVAMLDQIGMGHNLFLDVCVCPELPGAAVEYRKPSPRFALETMAKYSLTANNLCYVGDSPGDLLAAGNAGCKGVGVNTGLADLRSALREQRLDGVFPVFDNFLAAANYIADGGFPSASA